MVTAATAAAWSINLPEFIGVSMLSPESVERPQATTVATEQHTRYEGDMYTALNTASAHNYTQSF